MIPTPINSQVKKKKKEKKKKTCNKGEERDENKQIGDRQEVGKIEGSQIKEKKIGKKKNRKCRVERNKATGLTTTTSKVEIKVFGDSLVRDLAGPLTGSKWRASVTCLPGKGNLHIRKEVEKSPLKKEDVAVIAVSGNDLYKRDRSVGSTEKIISYVMGAVGGCKFKANTVVVVVCYQNEDALVLPMARI